MPALLLRFPALFPNSGAFGEGQGEILGGERWHLGAEPVLTCRRPAPQPCFINSNIPLSSPHQKSQKTTPREGSCECTGQEGR